MYQKRRSCQPGSLTPASEQTRGLPIVLCGGAATYVDEDRETVVGDKARSVLARGKDGRRGQRVGGEFQNGNVGIVSNIINNNIIIKGRRV